MCMRIPFVVCRDSFVGEGGCYDMVRMRGGGCNKSKPLNLATVDVSVYPSCHAESCHVTIVVENIAIY